MNKESIPAQRRRSLDELSAPGDFVILEGASANPRAPDLMVLLLPGEKSYHGPGSAVMQLVRGEPLPDPGVWGWDGNAENPTLKPSIENKGYWHGYLQGGRLNSCP